MRRLELPPPGDFLLTWAEDVLADALRRPHLLDTRPLLGARPLLDTRPYEIFGQGSRVNNTYLDQASDIDLVLMLKGPPSCWEDFRDDVLATMSESYVVRMGRRCLNVDDPDSLFGELVDILVATEYRLYTAPGVYEEGVFFRDREGRPIVNFPKQHRRHGDAKDRRTKGLFKETVRSVKRARIRAEQDGRIEDGSAPSYLLECLLYNVPDRVYRSGGALDWLDRLWREHPARFASLMCQNGINRLFGPGPDQWEPGEAAKIVDVLHEIQLPGVATA
jgi:hypothetical protein